MSESTPKPAALTPVSQPDAAKVMTVFVASVATLYFGKEVLVPVTLALLLAFVLSPLVALLRRLRLGKVISVLLGVVLALSVVVAVGGVIGAQIADLSKNLPSYVSTVEAKVASVREFTIGRLSTLAERVGHSDAVPQAATGPAAPQGGATAPSRAAPSDANAPAAPPGAAASSKPAAPAAETRSPFAVAESYLGPILAPVATLGIVFVVAVFALLQQEDLRDRVIRLVGSNDMHRATVAIDDGGRRLSRYFLSQLSINTAFGIVIGIGLWLIGVPNPVLWGILSGIFRFVPYIGSFAAAGLPMALAAAVEPGWSMVLWTAGLYVVVELLTGQIIEPLVYGHATGLSPFSVVVAAIFWSWVWGPIGLILSTPLTLCLVVVGRHAKRLQFLDVMLGDQPALTPVESFYQRILAGDADEAQDHAETLLKHSTLSSYYDDVALKGLQLAANDAERGVVDNEQLERIKSTIKSLVRGLADHDDIAPETDPKHGPKHGSKHGAKHDAKHDAKHGAENGEKFADLPVAWRNAGAVLCIAGRGALDEAASSMLAQLLGKHGLGARLIGYKDVSRDAIEQLDTTGVTMACISYLDISGSPAHLRYLIQRLRSRLPDGAPILVGLWPSQDKTLSDTAIQRSIGATNFTSSLTDAVTACETAAKAAAKARSTPAMA